MCCRAADHVELDGGFNDKYGGATGSEASKKQKLADSELPALEQLAAVFASAEYRELIQEVTKCGELCDRVDLATQVYAKGSHLLCHDDVIGTRKDK
eukprot:s2722_g3.t1